MANQSISEKVFDFIVKPINDLGYELLEVEYKKKQNGMNMTVYIDSKEGITLDDCEKVHKVVDALLDDLNPTNNSPYILNISSAGLDRPLKTDRDLTRVLGGLVDVSLYIKIDGKKELEGELKTFDDQNITIICNGKQMTLDRLKISKITKHIAF